MFIVIYEFEIKPGSDELFRAAWLKLTKAIYKDCGSFGSRLHRTNKPDIFVGYAQWPTESQWTQSSDIIENGHQESFNNMRQYLVKSKTVYQMEVSDDYLKTKTATED